MDATQKVTLSTNSAVFIHMQHSSKVLWTYSSN